MVNSYYIDKPNNMYNLFECVPKDILRHKNVLNSLAWQQNYVFGSS